MKPNFTFSVIGHQIFSSLLIAYALVVVVFDLSSLFVYLLVGLGGLFLVYVGLTVMKTKEKGFDMIKSLASISRSGTFVTDKDANILYANDALLKLTGYEKEELVGKNPKILQSGVHDETFYKSLWNGLIEDGSFDAEIWDKKKNGALYPKHIRIRRVDDPYRHTFYYVAFQEDLSGSESLAHYDARSLLPNQNALKMHVNSEFISKDRAFTLYFIRIQNRSSLEVAFGRNIYTELFQLYANKIKDSMSEGTYVAEITHYTLVVIVPFESSKFEACASRMVDLSRNLSTKETDAYFNVNIGLSSYPEDGKSLTVLMRNARVALDHVQYTPGKAYALHSKHLEDTLRGELEVGALLPKALKENEFHMVYQPQYEQGEIIGIEALMRWESPQLGSVSPEVFIKVAEKGSRMAELTEVVFDLLKRDLKKIREVAPSIRLSINISASQLMDDKSMQGFQELHTVTGIPARQLEIEITEGVIMDDIEVIAKKLNAFKNKNIRIAIDDFGTGFSTMTHLEQIPSDMLKIDKSFVMGYPEKTDGNIASLIISTADKLGLEVIAEGVETKEQKAFLESLGCFKHQGYLYSKPLKANDLIALMKK